MILSASPCVAHSGGGCPKSGGRLSPSACWTLKTVYCRVMNRLFCCVQNKTWVPFSPLRTLPPPASICREVPQRLSPRPSRIARLIRYRLLPPVYFLPVEKFSGTNRSPGSQGFRL